nr:hypothetical protein BaRGS_031263 [Batillaria attramentaria]
MLKRVGRKKHPIGIYSFDKGRDYQRQIREDLDKMLEGDVLEVHGSPSWAIEAHRQPTHSGESPLLANKFLSASKNGVLYYRPNRTHQYLTATELKDASEADDVLKYGRPTRTTLLRARQRAGSASSNAYEIRRQLVQRMDEIRHGCVFSNPKEFLPQQHTDIDGQSFHSFVTGARYNRAHCLDSKSLTQYGVYMPRNNPLGCFVVGMRLPLNMNREGPVRSESKLPSVHGTSLSKLRRQVKENADDNSDANQPPPSPVPTSARGDNSLPVVKPEGDADRKSDPDQPKQQPEPQKLKPVLIDRSVNVPSVSGGGSVAVQDDSAKQTEAQNEAGEEEEETEQKPADDKPAEEEKEEKEETAEPEEKTEEEGNAGTEEGAEAVSATEGALKEPELKMSNANTARQVNQSLTLRTVHRRMLSKGRSYAGG